MFPRKMKCANSSLLNIFFAVVVFASSASVFFSDTYSAELQRQVMAKNEWEMKSELVKYEQNTAVFHRLTFSSRKETYMYSPQEPPLGIVSDERVIINGQTYFLTGWAKGSATILYRVFAPSTANENPICEMTSRSEAAKLRIQDGKLQILILNLNEDDEKSDASWVECVLEAKEVEAYEPSSGSSISAVSYN